MDKTMLYIDSTGTFLNLEKMLKAVYTSSTPSITITMEDTSTFTYQDEEADYIQSALISKSFRIIEP